MTGKILITISLITITSLGCNAVQDDMEQVTGFEADRYLGTWYEIARLDHSFERDLSMDMLEKAGSWSFDTTKLIRVQHDLPEKGGLDMNQQSTINDKVEFEYFKPCPKTPNCVSSIDTSRGHFIQPLEFTGSAKDAQYRLLQILNQFKGARVVTFEENLIEAEFISSIFRFVDDVKFYLDDREKIIHVKSASRVGFSDLGVNRRRIEKIRKQLEQYEEII